MKRLFEYGTTSIDLAAIRKAETPIVENGAAQYCFWIGGVRDEDTVTFCFATGQAIYAAWKRYLEGSQ